MASPPLVLHIWAVPPSPAAWGVPSLDPACAAAVLALALAAPGAHAVHVASTPDGAPGGTLPALQHGHARAAGLPAVLHTAARAGHGLDLDAHLTRAERAQRTAWGAHAAQHLGALVAHALYGLPANWAGLAQPALAAGLPVPHRYYVPGRVRDAHRPRLAAAGLWAVPGEEEEEGGDAAEPRPFADRLRARRAPEKMPGQHFKDTFGRQKILQKARTVLDSYQTLLGDARFVFGDQPSTLDVTIAAHILLLTEPPYPDTLLKALLEDSYPTLVTHARRLRSLAFPTGVVLPHSAPATQPGLWSLLPRPAWSAGPVSENPEPAARRAVARRFALARWGWYALALASTVAFVAVYMPVRIVRGGGEDEEEFEEGEYEDEEDEEEDEESEHGDDA